MVSVLAPRRLGAGEGLRDDLADDDEVELVDPKGTGKVEGVVRRSGTFPQVDHTVILLGPGDEGEIVWTFFPGDPVRPSSVPSSRAGTVTATEARRLGLEWVKLAS